MSQQFRNVVYLSDRSGTGKWRRIWPLQMLDCIAQNLNCQVDYSQTPIVDQNYYKGMNSVTVQRWISPQQRDLFCKYFKPILDSQGAWLIYEIDDNMSDKCIPLFNRGRKAFEGEATQSQIKEMLQTADFVTVTTDYIKQYYHEHYQVPLENILAVPNFLPRYLFGDRYNLPKKLEQFRKFKTKPRVGIVSSLSHYNIDNVREDADGNACRLQDNDDHTAKVWVNEKNQIVSEDQTHVITDDFDEVCDCVRSTVNDVQWVMFGFCPPKIKDLVEQRKIEYHSGVPIMTYASAFDNLDLQAVVAPIKDMEFNRCKSFIKYMECAALGIPLFASDYMPYSRVMPKDQLFKDGNDLKEKLLKLKFSSSGVYEKIVKKQWDWLNSQHHEGDFDISNYWLEDNLNIYTDMFRLRSKTMTISMNSFIEQYNKRKELEKQNTLYSNDNVQILK